MTNCSKLQPDNFINQRRAAAADEQQQQQWEKPARSARIHRRVQILLSHKKYGKKERDCAIGHSPGQT